jgi:hypothetical protein
MPDVDRIELLLQECAILRREVAQIQSAVERLTESSEAANAAVFERLEELAALMRSIEARLPPLPQ